MSTNLQFMKNFLIILILSLLFVIPSQAEDIQDFQIGEISIYDNLLTKSSNINRSVNAIKAKELFYFPKSKKFRGLSFNVDAKPYEAIQFLVDKDYKIYSVGGRIIKPFKNDLKKCYGKMEEIYNELENTFPNASSVKGKERRHMYNSKATVKKHELKFSSGGEVSVRCTDWPDDARTPDGLVVTINSAEARYWLDNEAY